MPTILGELSGSQSRTLTLILVMDMRDAVPEIRRQGYSLGCFGPKRHYGVSGTCRHIDTLYAQLKSDWHKARAWILPFGDNGRDYVRARSAVRPPLVAA